MLVSGKDAERLLQSTSRYDKISGEEVMSCSRGGEGGRKGQGWKTSERHGRSGEEQKAHVVAARMMVYHDICLALVGI